jgi:DNA helicase-2/ATP-dependent DNA helicase PcrA
MELNREQKRVLDCGIDDAIKVIAGAGTGKTRVLVSRYLKFLQDDRVPPERLLALTFTNKAAAEMKKRIFEEVKLLNDPALLRGLYGAWIMNFHGFGRRILVDNADVFGLDPSFDVAGALDAARIKRTLLKQFEEGRLAGVPEDFGGDLPRPKEIRKRFDKCLAIANKCRSMLMAPKDLLKTVNDGDHDDYRNFILTVIAVWKAYREELRRRGLVDFDDMIELAAAGLRDHSHVRERYARQFDHILVDEFQDTSEAQDEFLRLLCGGDFRKVTVVGDEKQSIYRWRDARVENIRDFPGEPHVLNKNYRSSQNILDLAYRYICKDEYFGSKREEVRLESDHGPGGAPIIVFHPPQDTGKSFEEEANALAAWIEHLTRGTPVEGMPALIDKDDGSSLLEYEEVAVLLRSLRRSSGVKTYEEALMRHGIPYAIVGGANSVETGVLQTLYALLNLVIHPQDVQSLLVVLEAKPFSLNDAALVEMFAGAHAIQSDGKKETKSSSGGSATNSSGDVLLSEAALNALGDDEARQRCRHLAQFVEKLREKNTQYDLKTFLVEALEDSMFFYQLFVDGVPADIALNLSKELFMQIDSLAGRGEATLASFLAWLRSRIDNRAFGDSGEALLPPGCVSIMTIHQAKGLEFPAVAVPGIKKSASQGSGFFLSKKRGVFLGDKDDWGRGYKKLPEKEEEKMMQRQEERCLLYVAMTRAKDYLFVGSPYPEGKPDRGDTPFVDVLECAREEEAGTHEIRQIADVPVTDDMPAEHTSSAGSDDEISLLADWNSSRRALQKLRGESPASSSTLTLVTWRALDTFKQCPLKYYYQYVAGMSEELGRLGEDRPEVDDFGGTAGGKTVKSGPGGMTTKAFGTMLHQLLHETMLGHIVTDERIDELIGQSGEAVRSRKKTAARAKDLLDAFHRTSFVDVDRVVGLEERFAVRQQRLILRGVFDRIDRIDGGYRVIDYKSGKKNEHYDFQICFYAWAIKRIFKNENVKGTLLFLGDEEPELTVETGEKETAKIDTLVEELEQAILSNQYHATPGTICKSCEQAGFCPYCA